MKIQVNDYQHKATALIKALKLAKQQIVEDHADILLIDVDIPVSHYPKTIEKAYSEGAKVVLYSHGAPVITAWDGIWEPSDYISVYFAQSEGQKQIMEMYGYPHEVKVIGWHYCKQKDFQPCLDVKRVLFAPWHPHGNGWMIPEGKRLNLRTYGLLVDAGYELVVRHARTLYQNGIERFANVEYQPADLNLEGAVKAIDSVDCVVTNLGTLACLAVARGKPLVVYGQDIPPHDGYSMEMLRYVDHWDLYKDFLRYPYDISTAKPKALRNFISAAGIGEATFWRERFIGDPFNPKLFIQYLREVLNGDD